MAFPLIQWNPATSRIALSKKVSGCNSDKPSVLWDCMHITLLLWAGAACSLFWNLISEHGAEQEVGWASRSDLSVMDTGLHSEMKIIFKETGRACLNRCPCLSDNNNDTMCLFGRGFNYSFWLQGPCAESWIPVPWIYHTHRRILAFQTSSIRVGLPFPNDNIFLPWNELPSTSFKTRSVKTVRENTGQWEVLVGRPQ